jgi:hypothetical protein
LDSPDLENSRLDLQQLELVLPKENGASVRAVVALDVETRRIWFREEDPTVSLRAQNSCQEVEVIHLLEQTKTLLGVSRSVNLLPLDGLQHHHIISRYTTIVLLDIPPS